MQKEEKKNRFKIDKRSRRLLCALFLAIGLAITGISLAYFTSTDHTTNRLTSDFDYALDIVLTEPIWDSEGEVEAQKSVPGMEIDKDPYVTNYLSTDVYIRLKLEFVGADGTVVERYDANLTEFDYYQTSSSTINDDNKKNIYSRFLSVVYCATGDSTTPGTHLLTNNNGTVQSNNPYFYYSDGWFYYLDYKGTTKTNLKSLAYKEKTKEPLFVAVKLPVFKDEYNDLFADGFKIDVVAQAVDVDKFVDDDDNPTISVTENLSAIKDVFEAEFPSNN